MNRRKELRNIHEKKVVEVLNKELKALNKKVLAPLREKIVRKMGKIFTL